MGLITYIRDSLMRRRVIAQVQSLDWGIAESAIRRIPDMLDLETMLQVLLPLSRGKGSRLTNPLEDLPATPTYEFLANVHLSSAITALGKVKDARASARLAEIVTELPEFASRAIDALGSPCHADFASELADLAEKWPRDLQFRAWSALWHMETEEALELNIKLRLKNGDLRSEEVTREAWAARMEEIRNPQPRKKEAVRRRPLP